MGCVRGHSITADYCVSLGVFSFFLVSLLFFDLSSYSFTLRINFSFFKFLTCLTLAFSFSFVSPIHSRYPIHHRLPLSNVSFFPVSCARRV